MTPQEMAELRQHALDQYNYDETYAQRPEEVVAMAVTLRRFEIFQARIFGSLERAGYKTFPPEAWLAAAMLTSAAAITHLEEVIRLPAPDSPAPETENP